MRDTSARGAEAAARLVSAVDALLGDVERLPDELIGWKPAPDVWSVMEILCHVAEFVPYWTEQTLQIVEHPSDPWGRDHSHAGRLDAVARAESRTRDDVVSAIRSAARDAAKTLGALADADFDAEAPSRNPRWDGKPAAFVVDQLIIGHVEKHRGQVQRNVSQFEERSSR